MYKGLSRAQLSFDYLHTNSTTHEFLFGALAELLDNARDAYATKINIHSVPDMNLRGKYMLCFLDDGQGMSPEEASDIITFGKSTKKSLDSHMIGKYGNGLKSGSMRIGNDLILFTKKDSALTCVFLSRTFHEREQLEEIIVPMPSFDANSKRPLAKTPREKEKHVQEMELILKYSPFKTDAQFMKEFDKIEGASGTLVIIYNLKLLDTGEPELDVRTDHFDILLGSPDDDSNEGLLPERKSFRSYASILYVDPHMRVYIQGKKVRTKRIVSTLYKPRMYRYTSARFKARSEKEAKKAEEDARNAEFRAREAESKAKDLEMKLGTMPDKEQRIELRRTQTHALELRKEAQLRKAISERKNRSLKEPKQLVFVFGINLGDRNRDGVFVYNCSRLIKMYQKIGPQMDGGVLCNGIVGVIDAPYLVLEPTHNKQDFADAKEYRHLQQAMGEHMLQYWRDIDIAQQGVSKFWENFGYISPNWHALPSSDPKYVRKRTAQVQITLQCDLCLKWRMLPYSSNNINKVFPDDWVCSMNPDPAHNRCSAPEEKPNLPEGLLKKVPRSKEQKEKDLEEEIRRKQSLLEKMQKNVPKKRVDSSPSSLSSEDVENSSYSSGLKANKMKRSLSNHSSESESSPVKRRAVPSKLESQKDFTYRPPQSLRNPARRQAKTFSASLSSASSHSPRRPASSHKSYQPSDRQSSGNFINPAWKRSTPELIAVRTPSPIKIKRQRHKNHIKNHDIICDDDDDDDEDENENGVINDTNDDDDDDYPVEKRSKAATPSATYEKKNSKLKEAKVFSRISRDDEDDDDDEEASVQSLSKVNHSGKDNEASIDVDDDDDNIVVEDSVRSETNVVSQMVVGRRVKALVQNIWVEGKIMEENKSRERCRVLLDDVLHGITDVWFSKNSHDLQLITTSTSSRSNASLVDVNSFEMSTTGSNGVAIDPSAESSDSLIQGNVADDSRAPRRSAGESPPGNAVEAPTSSTTPGPGSNMNSVSSGTNTSFSMQAHEEIANGFRTCLRYFLPPQWFMDKEAVSSLSIQDLSTFPLDDFFDQYEKGLRKLVSSFQHEAQVRQCEAELSGNKLSTVRRMIAKLLKTINEDFEIDSECDSDEVDDLLALCLRQALEHARGSVG